MPPACVGRDELQRGDDLEVGQAPDDALQLHAGIEVGAAFGHTNSYVFLHGPRV